MRGAEFAELAAFAAVAEERNFRRAAARLGLSPSALSHTIRALEERLGARLLNRTTRSVAPSQAGEALLERLKPAMAEIEGAVRDVGAFQTQPRGVVRVNLPRVAARLVLAPKLGDFARRYPEIRLDLVIDDHIADVVAEGFDAGIRAGELVQRDMVAVRLTPEFRMVVVGSREYLGRNAPPRVPADLRHHACINYRWSETGALQRWQFHGPAGAIDVTAEGVVTANETDLLLTAALQGVGLAYLPEDMVARPVASGELVRVLDRWCRPLSGFFLYFPHRPHMPAAFRAFLDFMKLPD